MLRAVSVLVRDLPKSFTNCIRENVGASINIDVAQAQHRAYVDALRRNKAVTNVIHLPTSETHPDCVFIEDTAVVYNGNAVITRPGAPTRRGEEIEVGHALSKLGVKTHVMTEPATLDGGDVLILGNNIFVGNSSRTNVHGFNYLRDVFSQSDIKPHLSFVPVQQSLHLKSVVTWGGDDVGFIIANTPSGLQVSKYLRQHYATLDAKAPAVHFVPDAVAANVLRVGNVLYYSSRFEKSTGFFQKLAENYPNVEFVGLDMSELNKADGALTCMSLLIDQTTKA